MKPTRALLATIVGLQLVTGCGGGESVGPPPPPPPPALVVTTVEVTPAAPSLVAPDTVRLRATVKDQNGATMAGKAVNWTSGTPTVATVAADGLVTVTTGGQAVITAAVDGKSGSATVTAAAAIDLAGTTAVSGTIGPKGGILTTTGPGGVTYRFEVPPQALAASQSITMTPITALRTLGAVAFEAGVQFAPSGLTFAVPALLRISKKVTVASGNRLIGIGTNDAGRQVSLASAISDSAGLVLAVTHFSAAAAAEGTPDQIAQLTATPVTVPTRLNDYAAGIAALNDLMIRGLDTPQNIERVFHQWLVEWLEPEFANEARPPVFALDAIMVGFDYAVWVGEYESRHPGAPQGQALQDQTRAKAGAAVVLRSAIDQLALECPVRRSLEVLEEATWIAGVAVQFGLSAAEPALAKDRIAAAMCATIMVTQLDYPDPAIPNQASPLLVRAGIRFGNDPAQPLVDTKLEFSALIFGGTPSTEVGTTDPTGRYQFSVRPNGTSTLSVGGVLCLPVNQNTMADYARDMFCGGFTVDRPFGRTIDANVAVFSQPGLEGLRDVSRINGDLRIDGSTLTTTDLTELSQLATVTGTLTIGNAGSVRNLNGLRNLTRVGSLVLGANPLLSDLSVLRLVDVPGRLSVAALPRLADLTGLHRLTHVGVLELQNLPLITSLSRIGNLLIDGLTVTQMDGLFTLAELAKLPATVSTINVRNNAKLKDIGPATNVTTITGDLLISANPLMTTVGDLAALTRVMGNVDVRGPGITSLAGLNQLRQIDGSLQVVMPLLPALPTYQLPALTDVGNLQLVPVFTTNQPPQTMSLRFPALLHIAADFSVIASAANPVLYDLSLPVLASVGTSTSAATFGQLTVSTNALRQLTLGPVRLARDLVVTGNPQLTSLSIGAVQVGRNVNVDNNGTLATLSGGGGRVGGVLQVVDNRALSTADALAWTGTFAVTGRVSVTGNKLP